MNRSSKPVAIITGGTGGIGRCLSEAFHRAGYQAVAMDLTQGAALSEGIFFIQADLADESGLIKAFQTITERFSAAHVLINNGAVAHFHKPVTEMTLAEFDQVLSVNLRGSFICSKLFIEANQGQSYGRIINIASTRWAQNEAHWEAYGASKGGLVSLTATMAVSLSETPITVNAISPGWIETGDYEALKAEDHAQHPSGRVGKPEDIASACLFLADKANDFINGANLVIDGGMSKKMIYQD